MPGGRARLRRHGACEEVLWAPTPSPSCPASRRRASQVVSLRAWEPPTTASPPCWRPWRSCSRAAHRPACGWRCWAAALTRRAARAGRRAGHRAPGAVRWSRRRRRHARGNAAQPRVGQRAGERRDLGVGAGVDGLRPAGGGQRPARQPAVDRRRRGWCRSATRRRWPARCSACWTRRRPLRPRASATGRGCWRRPRDACRWTAWRRCTGSLA